VKDRVQIGPKVDGELWHKFREQVKERHGQVRGSLGDELENAIRNYIEFGPNQTTDQQLAEFNERLQRIEGAIGTAAGDGGATLSGDDSHTHAPSRVRAAATDKPAANAATEKKVAYLAAELLRSNGCDDVTELKSVPKSNLQELVKEEYAFRRDTAKRYVEGIVDELGLREHPKNDRLYLSEEAHEELTIGEDE